MGELLRNARHEAFASRNDGRRADSHEASFSRNDGIMAIPRKIPPNLTMTIKSDSAGFPRFAYALQLYAKLNAVL